MKLIFVINFEYGKVNFHNKLMNSVLSLLTLIQFTMEKFCLKWNDFQTTVSQSFGLFRCEEDFFDVTLVSDDEVQMSAHKLVLSACSTFFRSILTKNVHTNPLLYLSGVSSTNIGFILDYVYHGEVQIHQEQLDSFLDAAQMLRISGLTSDKNNQDEFKMNLNQSQNRSK